MKSNELGSLQVDLFFGVDLLDTPIYFLSRIWQSYHEYEDHATENATRAILP